MNTLDNIRSSDAQYVRMMKLLLHALPSEFRWVVLEDLNFLTVATDLFFILYSVSPRLTTESLTSPQLEGARTVFANKWDELMKIRETNGTVLNFSKSFLTALSLLTMLAERYPFAKGYGTDAFMQLVEYLLFNQVLPQLKHLDSTNQLGHEGAKADKHNSGPFSRDGEFGVSRKVTDSIANGFIESIYSPQGSLESRRRSSVISGVSRTNNPVRAKMTEFTDDELFFVKLAFGELKSREYGELELPLVITVDFSSSTDYFMKTLAIRAVALGVREALVKLRSRFMFVFFKDYPTTVRDEDVLDFILKVRAEGGTNINSALKLSDMLASDLGEDAGILLITDCEDMVSYKAGHPVSVAVVTKREAFGQTEMYAECIDFFKSIGGVTEIEADDVFNEPRTIGRRIGESVQLLR